MCDPSVKPTRGLHEPLVTQETFDRVQAILDGKKAPLSPRLKSNPDFPLRRLVRCAVCGKPLTGAFCKGRKGKGYPRYWCREGNCRAVSLPKAHLESEFQSFLGCLRADGDKTADFSKIAARVWKAKQAGSEQLIKKLNLNLEEDEKFKKELLRKYPEARVIEFPGEDSYWVRIRPEGDNREEAESIARRVRPAQGDAYLTRLV